MDISAIAAPPAVTVQNKKGTSKLSTTDFYKLLAAQIQYQSPFDDSGSSGGSSSSTDYLTNLAIMSATSAIEEMTHIENYTMASSMTGKKVSYKSTSVSVTGAVSTNQKDGTVSAVDFTAEKPRVYVTSENNGVTSGEWVQYDAVTKAYSNDVTFDGAQASKV